MIDVKVSHKRRQATDIIDYKLLHGGDAKRPPFTVGVHIDVYLPSEVIRQDSLCSSPSDTRRYQIAVLCELGSRGGSVTLHDQIHEGDTLAKCPDGTLAAKKCTRFLLGVAQMAAGSPLIGLRYHQAQSPHVNFVGELLMLLEVTGGVPELAAAAFSGGTAEAAIAADYRQRCGVENSSELVSNFRSIPEPRVKLVQGVERSLLQRRCAGVRPIVPRDRIRCATVPPCLARPNAAGVGDV